MFDTVRFYEQGHDVGVVWREKPEEAWKYKCRVCLASGTGGLHTTLDKLATHFAVGLHPERTSRDR